VPDQPTGRSGAGPISRKVGADSADNEAGVRANIEASCDDAASANDDRANRRDNTAAASGYDGPAPDDHCSAKRHHSAVDDNRVANNGLPDHRLPAADRPGSNHGVPAANRPRSDHHLANWLVPALR
jgi:hypothetical protein